VSKKLVVIKFSQGSITDEKSRQLNFKKGENDRETKAKVDEPESLKIQIKRHSEIGSAKCSIRFIGLEN
jgi:hypothetical protein